MGDLIESESGSGYSRKTGLFEDMGLAWVACGRREKLEWSDYDDRAGWALGLDGCCVRGPYLLGLQRRGGRYVARMLIWGSDKLGR